MELLKRGCRATMEPLKPGDEIRTPAGVVYRVLYVMEWTPRRCFVYAETVETPAAVKYPDGVREFIGHRHIITAISDLYGATVRRA